MRLFGPAGGGRALASEAVMDFSRLGGKKITGAEVSLRTRRTTTSLWWFPFECFFFLFVFIHIYPAGRGGGPPVVEDEKWSGVTTFDRFILPRLCTFITVTAITDALP